MTRMSTHRLLLTALVLTIPGATASAHQVEDHPLVVIESDAGLDDLVALAMALQHPELRISAVVAVEGAAGREKAVAHLERLLDLCNRRDIPLYAPAEAGAAATPPTFRSTAEALAGKVLPREVSPFHAAFSPEAYSGRGGKVTVLALGPLSSLAAALDAEPDVREWVEEVIVSGSSDPDANWNLRHDPAALTKVRASGIPMEFVATGPTACKPVSWWKGPVGSGRPTSVAGTLLGRLLTIPEVREHYLEGLGPLGDELAYLYYVDSAPFEEAEVKGEFSPAKRGPIIALLTNLMAGGRQAHRRTVLTDRPFPEDLLRDDVRVLRDSIVEKNGEVEWFTLVLLNEMHEHLGAYSVIGAKMGLRAAEILNAPRHGMEVVSRVSSGPPVSCLNDGIIVGTGCTVGRDLFRHDPVEAGPVAAVFAYNGRRVTLTLKNQYRERIRATIGGLLKKHTLEDREYWIGVRRLGLEIWEQWHRLDIFSVD